MLDILIAHYKEPKEWVKRLLDSISSQYEDGVNIYIANDGDEFIIDKELLESYPFEINYTIYERCGISKLRNLLIRNSSDKYFWFIDSDDYVIEGVVRQILDNLDMGYDLLCLGAEVEKEDGSVFNYYPEFHQYAIVGCQIFKRDWFVKNNLWSDETEFVSGDISIEILPKYYTKNKKSLPFVTFHYSYNKDSLTKSYTSWAKSRVKILENIIERLLSDRKYNQAYTEYLHASMTLRLYKELNVDANLFKDRLHKTVCSDSNMRMVLEYLKSKSDYDDDVVVKETKGVN